MNISVIGTGYVGLVTGVVFSDIGHNVICMDKNEEKIKNLKSGIMPIFEPGLKELTLKNMNSGNLKFTDDIKYAVKNSDIIFIAVDTMPKDNWETNLDSVEAVAREIAKYMDKYKVIVIKSTVPVGTGHRIENLIKDNMKNNIAFDIVFNPEFLREGQAIFDTLHPDRVIIGSDSVEAAMKIVELYQDMNTVIKITKLHSAELIKYASNAFLSMKISFINSMAIIAELADADIEEIAEGIGLDKRIGRAFLNAGIGYGGSCFPKDIGSLIHTSKKLGYEFKLLEEVRNVNELMINRFYEKIKNNIKLDNSTIALLGLAFKPMTDDIREARSVKLIKLLLNHNNIKIKVYDPKAMDNIKNIFNNKIIYSQNMYECVEDADAVALITEWNEFKNCDLRRIKEVMKGDYFFDGRNIYEIKTMNKLGFKYFSIGR